MNLLVEYAVWRGDIQFNPFDLPEAIQRKPKRNRTHKNKRNYGRSIEERSFEIIKRKEAGHWENSAMNSSIWKSITANNGSEFSRLSELEVYGISVYFAHPYSTWERPQNERHNKIFRRFIPKGVSIERYSAEQILYFADEMNAVPRKQLGYQTPEDLFEEFLDKVYSLNSTQVA